MDEKLICPLDKSHEIRKERMQFHLVKCMKNHNLKGKIKCPYNALHIIDKCDWKQHLMHDCENMRAVMEYKLEEPKNVASAPIITDRSLMPPCDENWDEEAAFTGTYDPFESAEGKLVLRMKIGLSNAKKKEWKQKERRRHQQIELMKKSLNRQPRL